MKYQNNHVCMYQVSGMFSWVSSFFWCYSPSIYVYSLKVPSSIATMIFIAYYDTAFFYDNSNCNQTTRMTNVLTTVHLMHTHNYTKFSHLKACLKSQAFCGFCFNMWCINVSDLAIYHVAVYTYLRMYIVNPRWHIHLS